MHGNDMLSPPPSPSRPKSPRVKRKPWHLPEKKSAVHPGSETDCRQEGEASCPKGRSSSLPKKLSAQQISNASYSKNPERSRGFSDLATARHKSDGAQPRFGESSEQLSIQLEYFVHAIRKDNANSFAKVLAAIHDLEHMVCRKLHLRSHSPTTKAERAMKLQELAAVTGSASSLDVGSLCDTRSEDQKYDLQNPVSPKAGPGMLDKVANRSESRLTASFPTSSWSSEPSNAPQEDQVQNSCENATRSAPPTLHRDNGEEPEVAFGKTVSRKSKISLNDEIASRLTSDAKIGQIEKFQTDMMMRTCGIWECDTSNSRSAGNSLSVVPDEALDVDVVKPSLLPGFSFTFSPAHSNEGSFVKSGSIRTSNFSLEGLRQQNDSILALSGLASGGPCPEEQKWWQSSRTISECASSTSSGEQSMLNKIEVQTWYSKLRLQYTPWVIFRLCGIVPWRQGSICANSYSLLVFLLVVCVAVYPTIRIVQGKTASLHICMLPITLSSLFGALSLRCDFVRQLFAKSPGPLELYSHKQGFGTQFLLGSLRQFGIAASLWVFVALVRAAGELFSVDAISCTHQKDPWVLASFLVGSFFFVMLLYCQLHVICLLGMMVDRYCINLFPCPDSYQRVLEWNLIQAMLRQIAGAFDLCFMMTQTGACAAMLLVATQVLMVQREITESECGITMIAPLLLPPVLLASGAFLVLFKAASVSEKCSRVAPLVNSMVFDDRDDALDTKRMNTVHFISSSGAGFYIQEVRITASMAIKVMYLMGLGGFAIVTKLATDTSDN